MKRLSVLLFCILANLTFAADPEIEQLKNELEALKELYVSKIGEVETRLAAIEQREKSMKQTVTEVHQTVTTVQQDVQEVRSLPNGAFTSGFNPDLFSFYGYMRAGYGQDKDHTEQEKFILPGAGAAYRLGNESDTYLETGFSYFHIDEDNDSDSPVFGTHLMLAYSTQDKSTETESNTSLRQVYVTAKNVLPGQPDATVWGGQRYYRRHDVHMNDFYWLDMSGYGGGIEDYDLGFATGSIAWIGGTSDDFTGTDTIIPDDLENTDKNNFDVRLNDIDLGIGMGNLWLNYAHYKFDDGGSTNDSADGYAVGFWLENELGENSKNTAIIQYGTGVATNFNSFSPFARGLSNISIEDPKDPTKTIVDPSYDADDQSRLRIMDVIDYSFSEKLSMQAVAIYQKDDLGLDNDSDITWYSVGVRPVYDFTELYSLAFEAGYDYSELQGGEDGGLMKFTIAPQITPDFGFFSRPAIRLFFTYATWSNAYKGEIGGTTYDKDTSGISYGVQVESWW
ncbi:MULTISPECIES: carbohydrate porin [unclassified Lentimonas]|uniref:carbohydrate porin n=1 Tax=unclassified Lentimonas TaxID=2630993 RepID=UPI001329B70C|nr:MULTISPECIES: carbohydrate porin [unclassified Lentimonas]CAA6676748.1 Maltoporin (maltose/maltodextrin high-affinity receptor, phage lambda receptor protein) [Lentimonas sp. CC4]CAA6684587.1 Maltoporin (maltose/maltodextrin high-affinity receptor, phage lambda receptor protein) [Lentimonas sp. CC6]CAA6694213.1 Maltoporin (maltose/maltodextrin high-affinity receptor, phage lambda receptor protein) [Lentimonas sp. CC10]CAA6694293.1 Maltoporin (maltose/maltodextrin high-affinity receptor, phag